VQALIRLNADEDGKEPLPALADISLVTATFIKAYTSIASLSAQ
jgi:hypothetical protein